MLTKSHFYKKVFFSLLYLFPNFSRPQNLKLLCLRRVRRRAPFTFILLCSLLSVDSQPS